MHAVRLTVGIRLNRRILLHRRDIGKIGGRRRNGWCNRLGGRRIRLVCFQHLTASDTELVIVVV